MKLDQKLLSNKKLSVKPLNLVKLVLLLQPHSLDLSFTIT